MIVLDMRELMNFQPTPNEEGINQQHFEKLCNIKLTLPKTNWEFNLTEPLSIKAKVHIFYLPSVREFKFENPNLCTYMPI